MKQDKANRAADPGAGVILEQIDSKLDQVIEGQQGLQVQIKRVDGKVDELQKDMDYKFGVVFDELHVIRNDLKEKVGRDEFVALEKRVLHLEKKSVGIER